MPLVSLTALNNVQLKDIQNKPRKRYGQHFLHDKNIIQKIINAVAPTIDTPIIEIGPGRGALTFPLLDHVLKLDVVEVDRDLSNNLIGQQQFADKLIVHQADALSFDFTTLYQEKIKVVGNLPYNISTPLLFHLLGQSQSIKEMVFMLQKDVVERICAEPNSKEYGRLSVMLQSRCEVTKLFTVSPNAFTPPPKVDSAIIRLIPDSSKAKDLNDPELFEQIVKAAFNYRRKTLRNALKTLVNGAQFEKTGIASTSRAEDLSVEDFILLANTVHNHKNQ